MWAVVFDMELKQSYIKNIKFVNVRYGNVLNSNGSIIPRLHSIGNDDNYTEFTLTHENMTRFVMTLEQSVDLIEYGILNGESGDTIVSELISMKVKDLVEIFRRECGSGTHYCWPRSRSRFTNVRAWRLSTRPWRKSSAPIWSGVFFSFASRATSLLMSCSITPPGANIRSAIFLL